MRKKTAVTRRRSGTSAKPSPARTSMQQAQDIALLSGPAAANRIWQLRGASPIAFGAAMNRFAIEKTVAFSSAWLAAGFAAFSAQLRWMRPAALHSGFDAMGEFETIARKTLQPIASRVRRNS